MRRLRLYFLAFFVLLAVPCTLLLLRTYRNLEQEAFFFYRRAAEGAAAGFSQSLLEIVEREERRPYNQYRYVHIPEQPIAQQIGLNVSPLAAFPVSTEIPGLVGYFQIDPDGSFHTPLLPDDGAGGEVTVPERAARVRLRDRLAGLLETWGNWTGPRGRKESDTDDARQPVASPDDYLDSRLYRRLENQNERQASVLVGSSQPAAPAPGERQLQKSTAQQAQIFDSELNQEKKEQAIPQASREAYRTENAATLAGRDERARRDVAESEEAPPELDQTPSELAAEVDPFRVEPLQEWLVFHRRVWWRDRRYIQGFVAQTSEFFQSQLRSAVQNSALPEESSALVFFRDQLATGGATLDQPRRPILLYEAPMPHAFSDFRIAFAVAQLPEGPGYQLANFLSVFLVLLVVGGLFGIYRLAASQIELSQKKSDFVAAVSHELKTPLASIRMYGEMLVEGWVPDDAKRQQYYRQIHVESERLSRLIQNVLRLAELERNEWQLNLKQIDPAAFVQQVAARLRQQAQHAGFELTTAIEGNPRPIQADEDALEQVLINLIDNAIKFSKDADKKRVTATVRQDSEACTIQVRDFGPGIPRKHLKRVFEKFYRADDEMTRSTRGTGIGLALVKMLAEAMGGRVEAANRRPGAEFSVHFPTP